MLEFGNKEFRNLQEQVGKNQEDIKALKTGIKISYWVASVDDLAPLLVEENYGKYVVVGNIGSQKLYAITKRANGGWLGLNLGDYPLKGETGDAGEQGIQGITGPTGNGIYGVSHILPSAGDYRLGDFFLLDTGALYKCSQSYQGDNTWILQCSLKGPQGIQGEDGDEVTANPTGTASAELTKIMIDGVIYSFPTEISQDDRDMLDNLEEYIEWEEDGSVTFGHDIYADGNIEAGYDVTVGRNLYVDDITKIQDPNGNQIAQGKLTAGTNVTISNNVISATAGEPPAYIKSASVSGNELTLTKKDDSTVQFVGEPSAYLKNASVSGDTLTITKKDDSTVEFTPERELPESPSTDGYYILQRAVSSGASSDSWENDVVRTSGNQSIGGEKTFTSTMRLSDGGYNTFRFGNGYAFIDCYQGMSLRISSQYGKIKIGANREEIYIQEKELPNYPATNPSPQCLSIGANGGELSWASYSKVYKHNIYMQNFASGGSTNVILKFVLINSSSTAIANFHDLCANYANDVNCSSNQIYYNGNYFGYRGIETSTVGGQTIDGVKVLEFSTDHLTFGTLEMHSIISFTDTVTEL